MAEDQITGLENPGQWPYSCPRFAGFDREPHPTGPPGTTPMGEHFVPLEVDGESYDEWRARWQRYGRDLAADERFGGLTYAGRAATNLEMYWGATATSGPRERYLYFLLSMFRTLSEQEPDEW